MTFHTESILAELQYPLCTKRQDKTCLNNWKKSVLTFHLPLTFGHLLPCNHMSCTVHYIDSSWELRSHCLQAHYTPEDHTGKNLSDALVYALQEWSLDSNKMVAITTDNAINIISACRKLGWQRLSCFSHNVDLAVHKGMDDG